MTLDLVFIVAIAFQAVHMLLHDWLDLHPLDDVRGVRASMPPRTRVLTIVGNTLPAAVALALAVAYFGRQTPLAVGLYWTLYYGVTLAMMYFAWYRPYLFGATAEQRRDHEKRYGSTVQVLPARGGNPRPNAAHVALHLSFLLCLLLAVLIGFNLV